MDKVCTKCGTSKSPEHYSAYPSFRGRTSTVCKQCIASHARAYYHANKEARTAYEAQRSGTPERLEQKRLANQRWLRRIGRPTLDQTSHKQMREGRRCEKQAAEYLSRHGWTKVTLTTMNGADITAMRDGQIHTFEVKKVSFNGSHYVGPISRKRINDDFFIGVWPDGRCTIEPMACHLMHCSVSRSRTFNKGRKNA